LAAEGFAFLPDWRRDTGWEAYLRWLDRRRRGLDLPPGRVPASFLVADVGGEPSSPRARSSGGWAAASRTCGRVRTGGRASRATGSP